MASNPQPLLDAPIQVPDGIPATRAARLAGVTRSTVGNMIERGDLKAYRFGRTVFVTRESFLAAFQPVSA